MMRTLFSMLAGAGVVIIEAAMNYFKGVPLDLSNPDTLLLGGFAAAMVAGLGWLLRKVKPS